LRRQITLVRDACRRAHYRSANAQSFELLAHLLLERLIVSVGLGLLSEFLTLVAMWRAKRCRDQKTKNKTPLANQEIQLVGGDLTEEKRHAAAITRVVEFGQ
jgi:hypothetical protein